MNIYNLERSFNINDSYITLKKWLKINHLTAHRSFTNPKHEVTHVELYNQYRTEISAGSGKGINHKVGALAEAIEHYILASDTINAELTTQSLSTIVKQKEIQNDYMLKSILSEKNPVLKTVHFVNSITQTECEIPYLYVNPFYASLNETEKIIAKYSTNSGTSLGLSFEDAYLHGINETIERHYYSLLCQDLIGKVTGTRWQHLDETTKFNLKKIASNQNERVLTIFTKTDYESYVAFSLLIENNPLKYSITPVGAGCSLSLSLSIQRSIDELMQIKLLYSSEEAMEDERAVRFLDQNTTLKKLSIIKEKDLLGLCTCDDHFYQKHSLQLDTNSQIKLIQSSVIKKGFSPLHRTLTSDNGIYVVQIFIPGMERFHLIRTGIPVVPQSFFKGKQ